MTITKELYEALTDTSAHGCTFNQATMYCVMNGLGVVNVVSQSWTGKPYLHLFPTEQGKKEVTDYEAKNTDQP